jgi:beta-phosphoglucomutase
MMQGLQQRLNPGEGTDPQGVIFDLDGVLTATDEYHYRSWKKVIERYGIRFTRSENEKLRGLTRRRSLEVLLGGRQLPEEEMGELLKLKNRYYLELVGEMSPADLLPGVAELLQELREARVRMAVASASRNVQAVLEKLGIKGYFNAIADGNSVRQSKPSPEVFLKAVQALDLRPYQCIAVEDSEAGIQSALAAGLWVVGLGPRQRVGRAHAVFANLAGVRWQDLREIYTR